MRHWNSKPNSCLYIDDSIAASATSASKPEGKKLGENNASCGRPERLKTLSRGRSICSESDESFLQSPTKNEDNLGAAPPLITSRLGQFWIVRISRAGNYNYPSLPVLQVMCICSMFHEIEIPSSLSV